MFNMNTIISVIVIIISWVIIYFNWFYKPTVDEYVTDDEIRFKATYDNKGNKSYIVEDKDGNISIAKWVEKE